MEGLGELFGAIGELFGGVAEFAGENVIEAVGTGVIAAARGDDDATAGAGTTFERYLAGAPRALHVNDI